MTGKDHEIHLRLPLEELAKIKIYLLDLMGFWWFSHLWHL